MTTYHSTQAEALSQPWLLSGEAADCLIYSFCWHILSTRVLGTGDRQVKKLRQREVEIDTVFYKVGPEFLEDEEKWVNSAWCQQKHFTKERMTEL